MKFINSPEWKRRGGEQSISWFQFALTLKRILCVLLFWYMCAFLRFSTNPGVLMRVSRVGSKIPQTGTKDWIIETERRRVMANYCHKPEIIPQLYLVANLPPHRIISYQVNVTGENLIRPLHVRGKGEMGRGIRRERILTRE